MRTLLRGLAWMAFAIVTIILAAYAFYVTLILYVVRNASPNR